MIRTQTPSRSRLAVLRRPFNCTYLFSSRSPASFQICSYLKNKTTWQSFLFFFFVVVFFLGKNTNYMDDLCLGYLLQGMCYRCVSKPKEAMESLLNTVNRSVTLLPATCLLVSFSLLIFVMDLESERVKTTGLFYMIRETPFRVWEQKTSARKLCQMSVSIWERSRGKDSDHSRPALTAHFFSLGLFLAWHFVGLLSQPGSASTLFLLFRIADQRT